MEPMTRSGLHYQRYNHWAIEAQSSHIIFFSKCYLNIGSNLRGRDVYDALWYSEPISNQAKPMVNSSSLLEGKYNYSKERKEVYVIFQYNTKISIPFTFDEQTDKKT